MELGKWHCKLCSGGEGASYNHESRSNVERVGDLREAP
jgi:hypothetical protein